MAEWARVYRTPAVLLGLFVALLALFAVTPDPTKAGFETEPTAEPTAGPRECVVCPIDQTCDPESGRCKLVEHTPWPCVESADFDERADFCLPSGVQAPPAPPPTVTDSGRIPGPNFPPGIRGDRTGRRERESGQNLPGFGD